MVLFTDSGADLTKEYLQEHNVRCLDFSVVIDGKEYTRLEDAGIDGIHGFYEYLRNGGKASTSQVNEETCFETFQKALADGDDVVYIGLSKGISGAHQGALSAAKRANAASEKYKVYVCDTMAASLGLGLMVDYAVAARDEGKTAKEFYEWHNKNVLRLHHWFTVDDLKFLARGGRISASSAAIGSLIKIKPVLNVDEEGRLISREKVRGRKAAIQGLANHMFATCKNADQKVFISHGDCLEEALQLKQIIKEKLGISESNFFMNTIGPVIGAHSGPGTIALF